MNRYLHRLDSNSSTLEDDAERFPWWIMRLSVELFVALMLPFGAESGLTSNGIKDTRKQEKRA